MTARPMIQQRIRFDEERARRMLLHIYPQKYADAELADAPDIVCPSSEIGVEVTSGLREDIQQNIARAASITGKTTDELTKNDKANIEKKRILHFQTAKGLHVAGTWATWGSTFSHEKILIRKAINLNKSHYRLFEQNELFVFAWLIDSDELQEALDYIAGRRWLEASMSRSFDTIYIFDGTVLTEVNVSNMQVTRHPIPNEIMKQISKESYETVIDKKI